MKFHSISLIIGCLLVFTSCDKGENNTGSQQNNTSDTTIIKMVDEAIGVLDKHEYMKSEALLNEAASLMNPKTDTFYQVKVLLGISEVYKIQGKYDNCLVNYYKALSLSLSSNDTSCVGICYYNISTVYFYLNQLPDALKYIKKAIDVHTLIDDNWSLNVDYILISGIYEKRDKNELARFYLEKAIHYFESENDEQNQFGCLNNLAYLFFKDKKYEDAITFYNKSARFSKKLNNKNVLAVNYGNIAEVYLATNDLVKAKKYIDSSMVVVDEIDAMPVKAENLERLVKYHKKKGDLKLALETMNELLALNTDVLEMESKDLIVGIEEKQKNELEIILNKNKINSLEKDQIVIRKDKERTRLILYFSILATLLLLVIFYVVYQKQKNARRNEIKLFKKEKEVLTYEANLSQTKLLNENILKEKLEEELNYKRKELRTFLTSLTEREKFLESLRENFKKIKPDGAINTETFRELKELLFNSGYNGEVELQNRIEEMNSSFHYNLKSQFPNLTKDDVRLASLLSLGLSSKEIASLLVIAPKSVDMKRYRLKKKISIDTETDLVMFLRNF